MIATFQRYWRWRFESAVCGAARRQEAAECTPPQALLDGRQAAKSRLPLLSLIHGHGSERRRYKSDGHDPEEIEGFRTIRQTASGHACDGVCCVSSGSVAGLSDIHDANREARDGSLHDRRKAANCQAPPDNCRIDRRRDIAAMGLL